MNRSGPASVSSDAPACTETSVLHSTSRSNQGKVHAASLYPSSVLLAFVRRQVAQAELYSGPERRTELRHLLAMPVVVQPVDEQIQPLADPQAMVIRDLCTSGVGLVTEQPFDFRRVVVRLSYPEENTLLAAEVLSTKPLGPFYHVGCEIIGRFEGGGHFPQLQL